MCVRLMLPGEKSIVTCPPDFAYDKFPRPANVPEGAHVQWEIELLGFEMPKDWTGFTFQEIMDDAEKIKTTVYRLRLLSESLHFVLFLVFFPLSISLNLS
jgi:hypothetical protein